MSVSEPKQAEPVHSEQRMPITSCACNILRTGDKNTHLKERKGYLMDVEKMMETVYIPQPEAMDTILVNEEEAVVGLRAAKEVRLPGTGYYVKEGAWLKGRGGQAQVYVCNKDDDDETYIAKLYSPNHPFLDKIKENNRLIREMKCSNLARLITDGTADDGRYMVIMEQYKELPDGFLNFKEHGGEANYEDRFLEAVKSLQNAMKWLHNESIYHSDIKPQNILLKGDPFGRFRLVLIDFGASVAADETTIGKQNLVSKMATFVYTAPEQNSIFGKMKSSQHTDIYAAGLSLAELIAGVYPKRPALLESDERREKEYLRENDGEGENVYTVLLPKGLPDYIVTLFRGVLYTNFEDPSDNNKYRWGDDELSQWVDYVELGELKNAAGMTVGDGREGISLSSRSRSAVRPGNSAEHNGMPVTLILHDGDIAVNVSFSTEEEMVELFRNNLPEIIGNLKKETLEDFLEAFENTSLSGEKSRLRQVAKEIEKKAAIREDLFDRLYMQPHIEQIGWSKVQLWYKNIKFMDKAELGQRLYACLRESSRTGRNKEKGYGTIDLKQLMSQNARYRDQFHTILQMFRAGRVSWFLRHADRSWRLSGEDYERVQKLEQTLQELGKAVGRKDRSVRIDQVGLFQELYLLAFHLQGFACFAHEEKIFVDYGEFLEYLKSEWNSAADTEGRVQKLQELGRAFETPRLDVYVWMLECQGIQLRPGEERCPAEDVIEIPTEEKKEG